MNRIAWMTSVELVLIGSNLVLRPSRTHWRKIAIIITINAVFSAGFAYIMFRHGQMLLGLVGGGASLVLVCACAVIAGRTVGKKLYRDNALCEIDLAAQRCRIGQMEWIKCSNIKKIIVYRGVADIESRIRIRKQLYNQFIIAHNSCENVVATNISWAWGSSPKKLASAVGCEVVNEGSWLGHQ